jgi:hypothetical protein
MKPAWKPATPPVSEHCPRQSDGARASADAAGIARRLSQVALSALSSTVPTAITNDAAKIFMPAGREKPVYAPYVEHVPPDVTTWVEEHYSFCARRSSYSPCTA